jgi:peroxiredoxin Q/BCP
MKVGDKAPQFCLPDCYAQKVCIRNYFGQWVVLYFYPRDNTSGCTLEAVNFSRNLDIFEELNASVIGISPDSVRSHHNFSKKYKLRITLLSDREKKVMTQYNVWRTKKLYGKEQPGLVRSTFLINPSGHIAYIWDNVRVKGHVAEVIEILKKIKKR